MNEIITNYNLLIDEFRNTKKNTSVNSIDKNISYLRRIEPILLIFNLKFKHIQNGKKLLKLLKQLHEIQYKISTLEDSSYWESSAEYLTYLKKQESEFISKINDFNTQKEVEFPALNKKSILMDDIYCSKTAKFLRKIEKIDAIQLNDIEDDVDDVFKNLNKFNKYMLASSYIFNVEPDNIAVINTSLKILNDIILYKKLISSLLTFYKNSIDQVENLIDFLDGKKMLLIDTFESDKDKMLENCKLILKQINNREINNIKKYKL